MKINRMQCIRRMRSIRRMQYIRCVPSDKPDFASVDEAICAALPLLLPFIKRAYQAVKDRERESVDSSRQTTPHGVPRHLRGKRKQ
jgi:hypothetical protein